VIEPIGELAMTWIVDGDPTDEPEFEHIALVAIIQIKPRNMTRKSTNKPEVRQSDRVD
jgi:hypothetical protein